MDLRALILGQADRPSRALVIPEWLDAEGNPLEVFVRALSSAELDAFELSHSIDGKPELRNYRARLAALVCVDAGGKRIFADTDAAALGEKNGKALDRIYDAARALNTPDAEGLEKN